MTDELEQLRKHNHELICEVERLTAILTSIGIAVAEAGLDLPEPCAECGSRRWSASWEGGCSECAEGDES